MKYYFVVGERSGDLHAGHLIKSLKRQDPHCEVRGFGGDYMQNAGAVITVHYKEMAVMGFFSLIPGMFRILTYLRKCKRDIVEFQPHVVVLVDYGGFNLRIAKYARRHQHRVFYYILPKVWAWGSSRVESLKKNVDRLFVILPFEKDFFQKHDCFVDYVGNPVVESVRHFLLERDKSEKPSRKKEEFRVALLPGSRSMEVKKIVPLMSKVCEKNPHLKFVVAAVLHVDRNMYQPLLKWDHVKLVFEKPYEVLSEASAAVVNSGTATLETALFKVPQVVVYKTTWLEYRLARWLIKVPFISLVNLIAERLVIQEMIQKEANPVQVSEELNRLLMDQPYRSTMLSGYDEMIRRIGLLQASEKAAELMVDDLVDRKIKN